MHHAPCTMHLPCPRQPAEGLQRSQQWDPQRARLSRRGPAATHLHQRQAVQRRWGTELPLPLCHGPCGPKRCAPWDCASACQGVWEQRPGLYGYTRRPVHTPHLDPPTLPRLRRPGPADAPLPGRGAAGPAVVCRAGVHGRRAGRQASVLHGAHQHGGGGHEVSGWCAPPRLMRVPDSRGHASWCKATAALLAARPRYHRLAPDCTCVHLLSCVPPRPVLPPPPGPG